MVAVIFSKHEFFLKKKLKIKIENIDGFFSKFEFEFTFKKLNF
jgi:hypothetical protein